MSGKQSHRAKFYELFQFYDSTILVNSKLTKFLVFFLVVLNVSVTMADRECNNKVWKVIYFLLKPSQTGTLYKYMHGHNQNSYFKFKKCDPGNKKKQLRKMTWKNQSSSQTWSFSSLKHRKVLGTQTGLLEYIYSK